MTKAQGLSMQTIVVAAIVIIVLIILIVIFSGKMNIFGEGTDDCASKGGECKSSCGAGEALVPSSNCPDKTRCCIPL